MGIVLLRVVFGGVAWFEHVARSIFLACMFSGSRFDPLCCLCLHHAGGEGHLVPVRLVFLDLEQLRRMQNFARHGLLELERPTLPDFLNAWCEYLFMYSHVN